MERSVMIKILIIDNEEHMANELNMHIQNHYDEIGKLVVIKSFNTAEAFIKTQNIYEVVFLEIELGGMNGITLAQKIQEYDQKMKIIFVANNRNYH